MDDLFNQNDGLFLRRAAVALGYSDRDIGRWLRQGLVARVRHGAYVDMDRWRGLDEAERHLVAARAVLLSHPSEVALSHVSGALAWGLRVWGADLSHIHLTRLRGGTARVTDDVIQHIGGWADMTPTVTAKGIQVLSPVACALGLAASNSVEAGLITLDSAIHLGLADPELVEATYRQLERWPYSLRLQVTARLATRGAQSVGESRLRYLCWAEGLPAPELQYRVEDAAGALVGITDFAWPDHGVLGEFDGRVKYERYLRPGESPGDAVFREKLREDRLREATGWSVVRFVWADLSHPARTADRIRRQLFG